MLQCNGILLPETDEEWNRILTETGLSRPSDSDPGDEDDAYKKRILVIPDHVFVYWDNGEVGVIVRDFGCMATNEPLNDEFGVFVLDSR